MYRHGGNIHALKKEYSEGLIDFSANINPLGPPVWLRSLINREMENLVHYPDPCCQILKTALAEKWQASPNSIVLGNGANELIYALPRALQPSRILIPEPAYMDYAEAAASSDIKVTHVSGREDFSIDYEALGKELRADDLVFLGHPANPTGCFLDKRAVVEMAERNPATNFIIDEAFIDFVDQAETFINKPTVNIVVIRSFTKFYAIPGIRLGALVSSPETANKVIGQLPAWSVNHLAQVIGEKAIQDSGFIQKSKDVTKELNESLFTDLQKIDGLSIFPSKANFFLCRLSEGPVDVVTLADKLLNQHGIIIRNCQNYQGLGDRYFRVAVRNAVENEFLCEALADCLKLKRRVKSRPRATPSLMFQGTSSNAGKSMLTAAFGRILTQDGIRVAPFKAQNMSNNSHVTHDGMEMARAQAVQAQACRLAPDVRMSPILLKPSSDVGSQVIVNGKPVGNMKVFEYRDYKKKARIEAHAAYDSLAAEYDAIVLEGAGSPGEVNLKKDDIANMRMAQYAQSPVLLVGDIDRGGVFASFIGTMDVLDQWERELVAGFVVNKFRGDARLIDDAFRYVKNYTAIDVLGTVPYLHKHGIPEEDSVSFKESLSEQDTAVDAVEIAVIDLPHISNFTDFDPLSIEPDVNLRVIRDSADFANADIVILPGSKNTIVDLLFLKESGIAQALKNYVESGRGELIGVCAGFQMMGKQIHDPLGLESANKSIDGLGFLDIETTLAEEKILRQTLCRHTLSKLDLKAYEIHHGKTINHSEQVIIDGSESESTGCRNERNNAWGSYLHGIFEADEFRRWLIDLARVRKNLEPLVSVQVEYNLEGNFDQLANVVRESFDMKKIYQIMGL